ncbi:DsrE family protein [Alienimonas californiensis]|uniref:DsrE/DsrF-like family protein n=1 Tax=Alienimonas californiensis TaxID=2527989 RepID=A0A517PBC6_9PLAN|nr:DsrE family protein [Alienimonas californiensis]QDT16676.1 DsrE/DsrF-like family protein [Alienimonas californiensis]
MKTLNLRLALAAGVALTAAIGLTAADRPALAALLAPGPAATAAPTEAGDDGRPVIGLQYDGPIKVVYQVSDDEWKDDVGKGLLYLGKLRDYYEKQGVPAERLDIRAVYHGEAAAHLLTDEAWRKYGFEGEANPNTAVISKLTERGVTVELCNARRQREGWAKNEIHPDVQLAQAAYARLIDLQHQGYAYIRF